MQPTAPSFFQGLTRHDLEQVLGPVEQRRFPAGTILLREGDVSHLMYVIESGYADIVLDDRLGVEHRISRVGPGASLGEMALFTGRPASATVRAVSDLLVQVLSEDQFHALAAAHPRIYQNLGAILSERLSRTNRRTLHTAGGTLVILHALQAPPLLGHALACSLAWHTRGSVLLLVVTEEPGEDLAALARAQGEAGKGVRGVAHLRLERPEGPHGPDHLAMTAEDLRSEYDYVLVQVADPPKEPDHIRRVLLLAPHTPLDEAGRRSSLVVRGWVGNGGRHGPDANHTLRVPPLDEADMQALRAGALPSTSAAGKALGWLARDLAGLKVGLALGGGVAKGYAHIGVLRVLARAGLDVDYLSGTSIGSAVGSLLAVGRTPDQAAGILDELGALAFRMTIPLYSLLSNARLAAGVRRLAGGKRIEDLPIPFGIVATDIAGGREVVLRRGPLWPAVVASMTMPGIYPPRRLGPYMLVDGGVVNPVPSSVVAAMGANTVLAVKLGVSEPPDPTLPAAPGRSPRMLDALIRSLDLMQSRMGETTAIAGADTSTILIEPLFPAKDTVGLRNFSQGRRYIELGEAAAEGALPRIAAALPWLRPPLATAPIDVTSTPAPLLSQAQG